VNIFKNLSNMRTVLMALLTLFISHNAVFAVGRKHHAQAAPTDVKSEEKLDISSEEKTLIGKVQDFFKRKQQEIQAEMSKNYELYEHELDTDKNEEKAGYRVLHRLGHHHKNFVELQAYVRQAVEYQSTEALKAILLAGGSTPLSQFVAEVVIDYFDLGSTSADDKLFITTTIKNLPAGSAVRELYVIGDKSAETENS